MGILDVKAWQEFLLSLKSPSEFRGNRGNCCVASFARLYLAHYIPRSLTYDVSLVPDTTRKAPRVFIFPEIQGWRFEATMRTLAT